ncbi:MAG TPA: glycosyltransferase [Acidimicrobiales bacterium]|nr:glycosyltransferase [Acidimicrobiales bacterium]
MLSVVIPARNAERWLGDQLEALAGQEVDGDWEVVLADNGSSDGTVDLFNRFASQLPSIRVVDASEMKGQAFARNVGVAKTTGDLLVFLDADDVVAPGYLAAMAAALARCDLATARLDYEILNPAWLRAAQRPAGEEIAVHLGFLPAGAGGSLAARRDVFERLGGFDVDMPPGEDLDFCWRAQLEGVELCFAPDAVLWYRQRQTPAELFRQGRGYGRVHPALYKRYRSQGMPRRHGLTILRFWGGLLTRAVKARSRSDIALLAWLAGLRVGLVQGMIQNRIWYL